jgi:hypothetical protein
MPDLPRRPPHWIATAPVVNRRRREMAAPTAEVWDVVADHEAWPRWFTTLKRVEITGEPSGVGGARRVSIPGIAVDEVFTAWEPGRCFAFSVVSAPRALAAMAESVELEPIGDDRCVVTYTQGIDPAPRWGVFWRRMLPLLERDLGRALDRLAAISERRTASRS